MIYLKPKLFLLTQKIERSLFSLHVIVKLQSSCYGHHEYCDMYSGCDNTWRDNIRNLLTGKLKYYKMTVNKWITYKCNCGYNTFFYL